MTNVNLKEELCEESRFFTLHLSDFFSVLEDNYPEQYQAVVDNYSDEELVGWLQHKFEPNWAEDISYFISGRVIPDLEEG